ncbi:MAG TPA: LCP family protein [Clostridiaceae bacterium]|nr:LCP family protein [Clostridiaceae bacterium]
MSFRKFYFALTSILLVFLFATGVVMLNYLKTYSADEASSSLDDDESENENILKPFVPDNEPFNVLVLIGDKSEANTDTMILVNYNPATSEANVMSIPRDTKIVLDTGSAVKINSLYAKRGGSNLLMNHLSNIMGIEIKHYVYLNIETFREIIDLLGGVWIEVPVDLDYDDPLQDLHIHIKKGKHLMDGKMAEEYLRFRHPNNGYTEEMLKYYDGSDLKRIEAQQNFIKELIKQKMNIIYLPKLNEIIDTVFDNLETNVTLSQVFKLVKTVNNFSLEKVKFFTLPGSSMDYSPYYYLYNEEEIKKMVEENFFK